MRLIIVVAVYLAYLALIQCQPVEELNEHDENEIIQVTVIINFS